MERNLRISTLLAACFAAPACSTAGLHVGWVFNTSYNAAAITTATITSPSAPAPIAIPAGAAAAPPQAAVAAAPPASAASAPR